MLVSSSPVTGQSFCPPNGSRGAAVAVEGVVRVGGSAGGSTAGGGRTSRRGKVRRGIGTVGANVSKSSQSCSRHRRGEHGSGGAKSGDLYLRVHVLPDARFERKGHDLHVKVRVPVTTAVLGGQAEVPNLAGKPVRLKIPPATQSGQVFRLNKSPRAANPAAS